MAIRCGDIVDGTSTYDTEKSQIELALVVKLVHYSMYNRTLRPRPHGSHEQPSATTDDVAPTSRRIDVHLQPD